MAIRLANVTQANTAIPLSLATTMAKCIATSNVILLPFFTRTRRRLPAKARRTSSVIHVTMVVRTAKMISIARRRNAAAMWRIDA